MWQLFYVGICWLGVAALGDTAPPPAQPRRGILSIDAFLRTERAIWLRERRSGAACPGALVALARIDALLEERTRATALTEGLTP